MPNKLISVKMPEDIIKSLDSLVKCGRFSSRSEAIRTAIRILINLEQQR